MTTAGAGHPVTIETNYNDFEADSKLTDCACDGDEYCFIVILM